MVLVSETWIGTEIVPKRIISGVGGWKLRTISIDLKSPASWMEHEIPPKI